jgi:hypothetical protein
VPLKALACIIQELFGGVTTLFCGASYRSRGGFRAALSLDEDDLVVDYEGVWKRIGENKNGG